jgi:hypothetical protein
LELQIWEFGFEDRVQNLRYKELAEELKDDPMQFFIQKTKQLKIELKKIDGLAESREK